MVEEKTAKAVNITPRFLPAMKNSEVDLVFFKDQIPTAMQINK